MDDGFASAPVYALLVVSVVASLAVGTAVAHPGSEHHGEHDALSENESARLWSLDDDSQFMNATELDSDRSIEQILLNATDYTWLEPPQEPLVWNNADIKDFPAGRTTEEYRWLPEEADETAEEAVPKLGLSVKDRSVGPSHANFVDGERGWIKDAQATTFAIQPSTRLRSTPGSTSHYVARDGTLIGTVDFRVNVPSVNIIGSDRRVVFSLADSEIENTCVVQGSDPRREDICSQDTVVIGSSEGSRTPEINYSATGRPGNQVNISLAAELSVSLKLKYQVYRTPEDAPNYWETVRVEQETSKKVVADEQQVTLYGLPRATAQTRRLPDGERMGVSFSSQLPWASVGLPSGSKLYSQYEFYTARDPRWDTLTVRDGDGSSTITSGSHPIRTYAVPTRNETGIQPIRVNNGVVNEVTRGTKDTPNSSLKSTLNVGAIDTDYTVVQTVVAETMTYNPSRINVTGFVAEGVRDASDIRLRSKGKITDARLSTTRVEFNNSHTLFRVTATDANGDPIRTAGTDAAISVNGERYNTNQSGQATIFVRNVGSPRVEYVPADWWATSDPHGANETLVMTRSTASTPEGITKLFIRIVVGLSVPAGALWLLDKIPGVTLWPPRELIR